jgi:hypothetical protein
VGLSHMGKFTFNPSSWYPKYVLARLWGSLPFKYRYSVQLVGV